MKVKMLAVLALVLLVSCASEGRIASKCELKSQLEAALGVNQGGNGPVPVTSAPVPVTNGSVTNGSVPVTNGSVTNGLVPVTTGSVIVPGNVTMPGNTTASGNVTMPGNTTASGNMTMPGNTTVNSLIAQIVCSVERLSRFDTSLVTTIKEDPKPEVRPPVRPQQSNEKPQEKPKRPGGRAKRSRAPAFRRPSQDSSSSESSEEVTTRLLGIFQLSDRVACDSGSGQSLNICKINCRALVDDDIRDDIACLRTLLNAGRNATASASASPLNQKPFLPVKECSNVNPAQYFAQCR